MHESQEGKNEFLEMNINGWLEVGVVVVKTLVRAYGTIIFLYFTFTNDKKLQSNQKRERKGRKNKKGMTFSTGSIS